VCFNLIEGDLVELKKIEVCGERAGTRTQDLQIKSNFVLLKSRVLANTTVAKLLAGIGPKCVVTRACLATATEAFAKTIRPSFDTNEVFPNLLSRLRA
jgi:hypothetical protein